MSKKEPIIFFDEAVELTPKQMKELENITVPKLKHGLVQFGSTKKGVNKFYESAKPREDK